MLTFFICTIDESKKFSRVAKKVISNVGCKEVINDIDCKRITIDVSCKEITINMSCKEVIKLLLI
jgi:hypothetical protein